MIDILGIVTYMCWDHLFDHHRYVSLFGRVRPFSNVSTLLGSRDVLKVFSATVVHLHRVDMHSRAC
jgi:hypothetical protein